MRRAGHHQPDGERCPPRQAAAQPAAPFNGGLAFDEAQGARQPRRAGRDARVAFRSLLSLMRLKGMGSRSVSGNGPRPASPVAAMFFRPDLIPLSHPHRKHPPPPANRWTRRAAMAATHPIHCYLHHAWQNTPARHHPSACRLADSVNARLPSSLLAHPCIQTKRQRLDPPPRPAQSPAVNRFQPSWNPPRLAWLSTGYRHPGSSIDTPHTDPASQRGAAGGGFWPLGQRGPAPPPRPLQG